MTVGEVLLEYRRRNKKSLDQVAEMTGITDRGWRKWELGESVPAPEYLRAISNATGLDYLHLMICAGYINRQDIANHHGLHPGNGVAVGR